MQGCAAGGGVQNSVLQLTSSQVSCRRSHPGRWFLVESRMAFHYSCSQQCCRHRGVTKHGKLGLLHNEEEAFDNCDAEAEKEEDKKYEEEDEDEEEKDDAPTDADE